MRLICSLLPNNNAAMCGQFQVALCELPDRRILAEWLKLRSAWQKLAQQRSNLYCIEVWDHVVRYGVRFNNADPADTGWCSVPDDPELVVAFSTTCETLQITENGVHWCGLSKHGDDSFETPEITWEQLQALHDLPEGADPSPIFSDPTLTHPE